MKPTYHVFNDTECSLVEATGTSACHFFFQSAKVHEKHDFMYM